MRILCASDFQIGAGRTLGITLDEHERWLTQIATLAESSDLFLFCGDAFEQRSTNRDQDEAFMRLLVAIARECPVLIVGGNHDWRGYERASTVGIFREIGVHVALEPNVYRFATPEGAVEIAALPWASLGRLVAADNGGDRTLQNHRAGSHLAAIARGLREQVEPGATAILAAHWAVTGASLPSGLPVDQLSEPVIEIGELAAERWDAIALGHVHRAQLIENHADVPVFYCGSPVACNWGEADDEHGVWILEPDPATRNERERALYVPRFVPLEGPRLEKLAFYLDELPDTPPYEVAEALVMDAIVRATIHGTAEEARRFDVAAFKRAILDAGARHVQVDLDVERAERARVEGMSDDLSELDALDLWLAASDVNGDRAAALRERTTKYLEATR